MPDASATETPHNEQRVQEIEQWLVKTVARALEIPSFEIDVNASFERYGMDSSAAVHIVTKLSKWLGRKLPPNLAYQYASISALARFVESTESGASAAQSDDAGPSADSHGA